MSELKRPRGRPLGSGKDDRASLAKVADKLLADPKMKPTTAMKRVMRDLHVPPHQDAATLRRWQDKWRLGGEQFMVDARSRHERRQEERRSSGGRSFGMNATERLLAEQLRFQRLMQGVDLTAHRIARDYVADALRSPAMDAVRQVQKEKQWLRDIVDPPHIREAREAIKQRDEWVRILKPLDFK